MKGETHQMLQIFKCNTCNRIVMTVHDGTGQLVCCDAPMESQVEKTVDAGKEKHVPVLAKAGNGYTVKVGTVPHPMEPSHYIEWIEVIDGPNLYVRGLKAGEKPEAAFEGIAPDAKVRAYCNVHGLWTNKSLKH